MNTRAIFLSLIGVFLVGMSWGQTIFTWTGAGNNNDWNNQNNWSGGGMGNNYPGQKNTNDIAVFNIADNDPIVIQYQGQGNALETIGEIRVQTGSSVTLNVLSNLTATQFNVSGGTINISGTATLALTNYNNSGGTFNANGFGGAIGISGTLLQSGLNSITDLGGKVLPAVSNVDIQGGTLRNGTVTSSTFTELLNASLDNISLVKNGSSDDDINGGNIFLGTCSIAHSGSGSWTWQDGTTDLIGRIMAPQQPCSMTITRGGSAGDLILAATEDLVVQNGDLTINGAVTYNDGNAGAADGNLVIQDGFLNVDNDIDFLETGELVFSGAEGKSFDGGVVTVDKLNIQEGNVSLSGSVVVSEVLKMNGGVLIPSPGTITLDGAATASVGNSESYVNGPLSYRVRPESFPMGGSTTIRSFQVGKNGIVRPVDLTLTANNATTASATFTAELKNESAEALALNKPIEITRVSSLRYWQIDCSGCGTQFSNATVALEYRDPDAEGVTQTDFLVIAKSDNGSWMNLGGSSQTNSNGNLIQSTVNFTSFSVFTLASTSETENALPVELLSFTAAPAGDEVRLAWRTATETGNDYFAVEHSTDGRAFRELGRVAGAGDSATPLSYDYTHAGVPAGAHYYRLRQVDFDGSYEYSDVVSVQVDGGPGALRLFPNPTGDEVQVISAGTEALRYDLFDAFGRLLRSDATAPQGRIDLSGLAPGTYILRVSDLSGRVVETERVVKR